MVLGRLEEIHSPGAHDSHKETDQHQPFVPEQHVIDIFEIDAGRLRLCRLVIDLCFF